MNQITQFNSILETFKIKAKCVNFKSENGCYFYDLKLCANGKVKDIQRYSDEISLIIKAPTKPGIRVLHDQGIIRMEFVLGKNQNLNLLDYFTNRNVPKGDLICLLGRTVDGSPLWMDLAANPHLIIAGTTGSGKSSLLHNIIANMMQYNNAKIYLVDPKQIEFGPYHKKFKNISVSFSYAQAIEKMDYLISVMESRYDYIRKGVSSKEFPPILLMIDEVADLMMQSKSDEFYDKLLKLAQKSRAAKIHIVMGTQRPSASIINGNIKANFPARIALKVASHTDSKIILNSVGAENLLGKGDALMMDNFRSLIRFQVAYANAEEVCKLQQMAA
jgi:DNA segregation ATPase FtsK/SpoIIIE, S-DNA-T family